jgi:hypothetical protein
MKPFAHTKKYDNYYSYNELVKLGWKPTSKNVDTPKTFPESDIIVLEKDNNFLTHLYSVYTDSSDYPGHENKVYWRKAKLRSVTKYVIDYE